VNVFHLYLVIVLIIYLVTLIGPTNVRKQWARPIMAFLAAFFFIFLWLPIIGGLILSDLRKKARRGE